MDEFIFLLWMIFVVDKKALFVYFLEKLIFLSLYRFLLWISCDWKSKIYVF